MARVRYEPQPGRHQIDSGVAELLFDADRAGSVELLVDGVPQSHVDTVDPTHLDYAYVRLIGDLVDLQPEGPLTVLHLGGGACTLARYVSAQRPGSTQLVVEIDGKLAELVRAELGTPGFKLRVGDARAVVAGLADASSDLVVGDCFTAAQIPGPTSTIEHVSQVARVLRPGGAYALNVGDGTGLAFTRSAMATLQGVFAHTVLLSDPGVLRGRRFGNLVLIGSDAPLPLEGLRRRAARAAGTARVVAGDDLVAFVAGAPVLTDAAAVPTPTAPKDLFA